MTTANALDNQLIEQLRHTIGHFANYKGQTCRIIELIEDGPWLVLTPETADAAIQPNQFGEAHRRTQETFTVPIYAQDSDQLLPFVAALIA